MMMARITSLGGGPLGDFHAWPGCWCRSSHALSSLSTLARSVTRCSTSRRTLSMWSFLTVRWPVTSWRTELGLMPRSCASLALQSSVGLRARPARWNMSAAVGSWSAIANSYIADGQDQQGGEDIGQGRYDSDQDLSHGVLIDVEHRGHEHHRGELARRRYRAPLHLGGGGLRGR